MNKIIEEQLRKCQVADLSKFDTDTNTYHIARFKQVRLEVNSCYLIKLSDILLDKELSSILSSNWNRGTVPTSKYMKIDVSKVLGKMIYINGIGYDFDNKVDTDVMWSGWLPIQDIEVIERI